MVSRGNCGSGASFDRGGEAITFSYDECSLEWTVDLRASRYPLPTAAPASAAC